MEKQIRLATIEDLSKILKLIERSIYFMEANDIHQWDEFYPDKKVFQTDIEESSLWVMETDDILGIIVINEQQTSMYQQVKWKYNGKVMVVHRLAVDPAYQGKNIGTQLMKFGEDKALERGYESIRLDAFIKNPGAVRLYQKLNYLNSGTITLRKGDFYCFEKKLTQ